MQTVYFKGILTTLAPLSHNSDESTGVDIKFRRVSIMHQGRQMQIPVYSGNAFRGILRRIAARQYCDALGLDQISDALYYAFFTGGSLKKGHAQSHIEIGKKRELRDNIPFLSLFGSAIENQIIQGKTQVDIGLPIAKETSELTGINSELTIWEYTDELFYTRRDDLEDKEKQENAQAQQMKYTLECIVPGVVLQHGIVVKNVSDIELSCFGHAMREMQKGGILGGKSGTGHGRVKFDYEPEWPDGDCYLQFLSKNKENIVEYVRGLEARL